MQKKEGFFGTENLHRAGWGLLLAVVTGLLALVYKWLSGPQQVVIASHPDQGRRVIQEVPLRGKEVLELAEAIRQLAKASEANANQDRLRELSAEVDRLRAEIAQSKRAATLQFPTYSPGTTYPPAQFHLPDSARGHTVHNIFGVTAATCPPSKIALGSSLGASFSLADSSLISRASPLRITVARERSPVDLLQISETWEELQAGTNQISLKPSLTSGKYQLSYGFFLRDKLSGEYPPFYSRTCTFEVKEH